VFFKSAACPKLTEHLARIIFLRNENKYKLRYEARSKCKGVAKLQIDPEKVEKCRKHIKEVVLDGFLEPWY